MIASVLFSAPMVRAILAGTKTQTRRVLNPQPRWVQDGVMCWRGTAAMIGAHRLPYSVGDRLWVRESYFQRGHWEPVVGAVTRIGKRQKWRFVPADETILFDSPASFRKGRHAADPDVVTWHRRLGRFMPRRASRLTLTVTDVRVERLQDISEEDALAEGVVDTGRRDGAPYQHFLIPWVPEITTEHEPSPVFASLWERINGPGAWAANPWVAAYTFTVEHRNIDAMTAEAARCAS